VESCETKTFLSSSILGIRHFWIYPGVSCRLGRQRIGAAVAYTLEAASEQTGPFGISESCFAKAKFGRLELCLESLLLFNMREPGMSPGTGYQTGRQQLMTPRSASRMLQ
jgi:hypothetical protein